MKAKTLKNVQRVADMSIADVLKTPEFFKELSRLLGTLRGSRDKARWQVGGALKAHPIDKLIDEGVWSAGKFSVLYAQVLDKVDKTHSSTVRAFVAAVGGEAFDRTMVKLINDEKTRDKRSGGHK